MANWQPDVVIYHDKCHDGLGAALMAYRKWGMGVEFFAANHGEPPPDVTDKNVLIVDFSYSRETLRVMGESARTILVLDHHKSAQEALAEFVVDVDRLDMVGDFSDFDYDCGFATGPGCNILAVFDMERSGAGIAHDFLFPGEPRPLMIDLIEARDLWRFEDVRVRPFHLFLQSLKPDFFEWLNILEAMEEPDATNRNAILDRGRGIEAYVDVQVGRIAGEAFIGMLTNGDRVPMVMCNFAFASEVGHALLDRYPSAPYVATFAQRRDGKWSVSLRSQDGRQDVSEVAVFHGGGGHRNAAGFVTAFPPSFVSKINNGEKP